MYRYRYIYWLKKCPVLSERPPSSSSHLGQPLLNLYGINDLLVQFTEWVPAVDQ